MSKDSPNINKPKEKSQIELLLEKISNNTSQLLDTDKSTQNNNTTNNEIKQVSESIKKTNESLKQVSESLQKVSDKLSKTPTSHRRTREQVIIDKANAELATLKLQETLLKQTRDSVYMQSKISYMQKEAQKQYEESYKDSSVYKAYHAIKTAPSTPVTSVALSAATGGILNPAVIGALHLDKVLNAAVGGMIKSILRPKKQKEYGGSSSAIEKEEPINKIPRQLDQILQKLDEKNKNTNTKEEKKKNSIFKTIMQAVKGFVGTVLPAIGMMTLLLPKFANALENRIIETLGIDPKNADKTKKWLEDILPFVLIGSKWGIKGALWGAVFGIAKHSVEELADDWKNIKKEGFTGDNVKQLIIDLGLTGTVVAGAVLGYKLGGLKGAAIGAAVAAAGYGTAQVGNWLGEKIADLTHESNTKNNPSTNTPYDKTTVQNIESEKRKRKHIKELIKDKKATGEISSELNIYKTTDPELVKELEGIVDDEEMHQNDFILKRGWNSLKKWWNDDEGLGDYRAAALLNENSPQNLQAYNTDYLQGLNRYTDVPWDPALLSSDSFKEDYDVIPSNVVNNLNAFHNDVITPFQYYLGSKHPITMTSSYRAKTYNASIHGGEQSKHLTGNAIDMQIGGLSPKDAVKLLKASGIPFDKAIMEQYGQTKWLHLEYFPTGTHRGEIANITNGKYTTVDPGSQGDDISLNYGNNYSLETNNMNSLEAQNNLNFANINSIMNNRSPESNNDPYNLNYEHTPYPTTQQAPIIYNIGSSANDGSAYPSGDAARTLLYTY